MSSWASGYITWPSVHGEPELLGGGGFGCLGGAVATLGARLLGRGGDKAFQFGIKADAHDAPAVGLDARPLV